MITSTTHDKIDFIDLAECLFVGASIDRMLSAEQLESISSMSYTDIFEACDFSHKADEIYWKAVAYNVSAVGFYPESRDLRYSAIGATPKEAAENFIAKQNSWVPGMFSVADNTFLASPEWNNLKTNTLRKFSREGVIKARINILSRQIVPETAS